MASAEVFEVVVGRGAWLRVSDRCACCGDAAATSDPVNARGLPRTWFLVGLCWPCQRALTRGRSAPVWMTFGLMGLAGAVALALAFVPEAALPLPWFALPALLPLVAGLGLLAWRRRPPGAPRTARDRPVRITVNAATHVTIACTHRGFAEALAWLNGGSTTVVPAPGLDRGGLVAVALAVGLGALCAWPVWDDHYPEVAVDSLFSDEVVVWVDGVPGLHVAPGIDPAHMPTFRLPKGHHTLGYSGLTDAAPLAEVHAELPGRGHHLYNPAKLACYFRDVTVYGTTRVGSVPLDRWGPLDRREVYVDVDADFLFEDPPSTIDTQGSTSNLYRVALYRDANCTELALSGCPESILGEQIECNAEAMDERDVSAAVTACAETAVAACRAHFAAQEAAPAEPAAEGATP